MKSLLKLTLIFTFSLVAVFNLSAQTHNLRFAPKKDKNYTIIMKTKMSFGTSTMSNEVKENKNDMIIYLSAIPKSTDSKGQVTINCLVNRITAVVTADNTASLYDSEKANTNPKLNDMDNKVRKIINKPFVMLFSQQGKFISAEGLPENTEFIRNFRFATTLPAKPVKIGDTWVENIEDTTNGMVLKSTITYKLEEIKNNELHISYLGDVQVMGMNNAKAMKGTSILDKNTGWTKNSNGLANMEIDLKFMKISVKSEIVYESK